MAAHQATRRFTSSTTIQTSTDIANLFTIFILPLFTSESVSPVIGNIETTSSSILFNWIGVPGVTNGYFVQVNDLEPVFVREKHFTMGDLTPFTNYKVSVTGHTSNGDAYSSSETILSDPEPPTISLINVSSSGLLIEWTTVPAATVYLTEIRDQEGLLIDQRRAHSVERFEYNNLSPFRQYKVLVSAQYGKLNQAQMCSLEQHLRWQIAHIRNRYFNRPRTSRDQCQTSRRDIHLNMVVIGARDAVVRGSGD